MKLTLIPHGDSPVQSPLKSLLACGYATSSVAMCMLTHPRHQGTQKDVLAQVVEHHDVGVHVEEVIAVGRVVL